MPDNPRPCHKPLTAAILPTYNEELNVAGVLEVLRATSLLDEIILVDDGSTDRTIEILNQAAAVDGRIQVIRHDSQQRQGPGNFHWLGRHLRADPAAAGRRPQRLYS